jgi:hypothetical protein
MDARKTKAGGGNRPAFRYSNEQLHATPDAANDQPGADVFVGRTMRSLRRFAELRLQDAKPARCLVELGRAADALSSAVWAMEYEAGLCARGER